MLKGFRIFLNVGIKLCPYTTNPWTIFLFGSSPIDVPMQPVPEDQNCDDVIWDVFELNRDQITLVRKLGTGNFGQVSKATCGDSRLEVAVKSLKGIVVISLTTFFLSIRIELFINKQNLTRKPAVSESSWRHCQVNEK